MFKQCVRCELSEKFKAIKTCWANFKGARDGKPTAILEAIDTFENYMSSLLERGNVVTLHIKDTESKGGVLLREISDPKFLRRLINYPEAIKVQVTPSRGGV